MNVKQGIKVNIKTMNYMPAKKVSIYLEMFCGVFGNEKIRNKKQDFSENELTEKHHE